MVGCGYMSAGLHGPAIKKYEALCGNVRFAACCDTDAEKARRFKEDFGLASYYTDTDAMLEAEKPDAVSLIVPVDRTADLACDILRKGYPLITEKPPGMDAAETLRMIKAASEGGAPNQVAFNRRYMPLVQKLMELLHETGRGGCVTDVHYKMTRVRRIEPDFSTTAIHGIDLVRHIAKSDYRSIDFKYREITPEGAADIRMDCEMASGAYARLDFLPDTGVDTERLEINANRGTFLVNLTYGKACADYPGRLRYFEKNKLIHDLDGGSISGSLEEFINGGFYGENASFLDDVINGRKPAGDIASGLQPVEIACCVRRKDAVYRG